MEFNRLSKAIRSLYESIDSTGLTLTEKNNLKVLIEKIAEYYKIKYEELENCRTDYEYQYKSIRLTSKLTDYIVLIHNVIIGYNNVQQVINTIYKDMNFSTQKKHFKRKRLI